MMAVKTAPFLVYDAAATATIIISPMSCSALGPWM